MLSSIARERMQREADTAKAAAENASQQNQGQRKKNKKKNKKKRGGNGGKTTNAPAKSGADDDMAVLEAEAKKHRVPKGTPSYMVDIIRQRQESELRDRDARSRSVQRSSVANAAKLSGTRRKVVAGALQKQLREQSEARRQTPAVNSKKKKKKKK